MAAQEDSQTTLKSLLAVSAPLEIKPGRVYVLECPDKLCDIAFDNVRRSFSETTGAKAIILEQGMRIARALDLKEALRELLPELLLEALKAGIVLRG